MSQSQATVLSFEIPAGAWQLSTTAWAPISPVVQSEVGWSPVDSFFFDLASVRHLQTRLLIRDELSEHLRYVHGAAK